MKSVACPYCQTELVGNFRPGDTIECDSCKGRFQPPSTFLKEYSPRHIVCPYCKTILEDSIWSERFIQCPTCKGQFEKTESSVRISTPRPKGISIGTGLLAILTILESVFFVVMFLDGRMNQRAFLMEKAIRWSLVSFPIALCSAWIAWAIFKGRNWPRWLLNAGLSCAIVFSVLQTAIQFVVTHHDWSVEANELCLFYSLELSIKLLFGIGILCFLNTNTSRNWLHLPQSNKHSHDFPWWTIVLLFVLLCPILLLIAPSSSRKPSFSQSQNGRVQTSLARTFSSTLRHNSNRDDSYHCRAQYLSETLSIIKACDGDTPEAMYSTAKGFGIEGKPLSRWFEMVQSDRFISNASQTIEGRNTFNEVEIAILTAAGKRGLLNEDINLIDNGPVYVNGYGLVRNRKELEEGRIWVASRNKEQTYVARKIDFLARFFDPNDRNAGFMGSTLWSARAWALGANPINRGDAKSQELWDDLVQQVDARYWNKCSALGFRKEYVGESSPARKAVSTFLRNPAAAMSLVMVQIPEKNYLVGRYEVTQALWQEIMDGNPSSCTGESYPIENVSWNDCQTFVWNLNELPEIKEAGLVFRLPTKDEWVFAARANASGNVCKMSNGIEITTNTLGRVAWFEDNSNDIIHPIGQKEPNAFGLFDVFGNVEEWTQTPIDDGYSIRGGGYYSCAKWCTTSEGVYLPPDGRDEGLGFRLCATVNLKENK